MSPSFSELDTAGQPPCIGFADAADPSCKRCEIFQDCLEYLQERRPPCYGAYDPKQAGCIAHCIMASTCAEVTKGGVTSKTKKQRKRPVSLESALDELQADVEDRLEASAYDDMSRYALRKLCDERGIEYTRRTKKSALIMALRKADKRKVKKSKSRKRKVVVRRK